MAGRRSSHEQKSRSERENYVRNTIRKVPGPTVDEGFSDTNSTETVVPVDTAYNRTRSTRSRTSPFFDNIREKWPEIALGLILIPTLGFLFWQAFTLNREVGELRIHLDESREQAKRLEAQIDKLNERLDRLNQAPAVDPKK